MLTKFGVVSLSLASLFASLPAHADINEPCTIQFAVSTPPIQLNQNVAFNVINESGISRSLTLAGGSAPQFVDHLPCSNSPYTISATIYYTPLNNTRSMSAPAIGECVLKAGSVLLSNPYSSISVVFPNDFICPQ